MHPGNIYVSDRPETLGSYIALDFGIVGSLSEFDKNYLAQNFLAFFHRDYRRVRSCISSQAGCRPTRARKSWRARCAPCASRTRSAAVRNLAGPGAAAPVPDLAALQCRDPAAVGAAAEDAAQRRGPGTAVDPNLDLWKTAKPYLERWMRQRVGIKGLRQSLKRKRRSGRRCRRRCPGWSTTISTARTSRPPCWPKWSSCAGRKSRTTGCRGPGRRDRAGCRGGAVGIDPVGGAML